jgi:ATP-dependent Lon protease
MTQPSDTTLPVLVLRDNVLFPGIMMPLSVGRPASIEAIEAAAATPEKIVVVACQTDATVDEPNVSDLFRIGTRAAIKRLERTGELMQVVVEGIERVELLAETLTTPHLAARVQPLPEPTDGDARTEALQREIMDLARRIAEAGSRESQLGVLRVLADPRDPVRQAYLLAALVGFETKRNFDLLAASTRYELLRLLHEGMLHERNVLELRKKIASQAQAEMSEEQRRYLLRQQLRAIEQELGEGDSDKAAVSELADRLQQADLPEAVRTEAEREMQRLGRIPPASPEHQLTQSWLELVLELPWNRLVESKIDLARARAVLDEDHAGLPRVKERILEHLAVMQLNPGARAPILCFVGPPGVGKTSLGQSIARAIERPFERMSLGGLHDEAELRGHRRTYIGAMPGRILQAIRPAKAKNPLLMLDEIDKVGTGVRGDPASALLEVLDPAQNGEFHDNYLDLPFDLSNVFFIATANVLETIPAPLLDRMEVIRLSGYTDEEKLEIARRYLLPRQRSQCGLREDQLVVTDEALRRIVRRHTREAGVRQLERVLAALARKAAARVAAGTATQVVASEDALEDLLGPERFADEEMRPQLDPGVAAGLAWTEAGGAVLYIEAVLLPRSRELLLTGQLGEVMQESARAALSWLRSHGQELGLDPGVLGQGVHLHIPAGATPKDGPSAGVAMATALASMFARQRVRRDLAMTGEITLSGLVLPVGGIKEKVLAAQRAGMRAVVLPKQNQRDLGDIPPNVRADLQVVFAERVTDALAAAIPGLLASGPQQAAVPGDKHGDAPSAAATAVE